MGITKNTIMKVLNLHNCKKLDYELINTIINSIMEETDAIAGKTIDMNISIAKGWNSTEREIKTIKVFNVGNGYCYHKSFERGKFSVTHFNSGLAVGLYSKISAAKKAALYFASKLDISIMTCEDYTMGTLKVNGDVKEANRLIEKLIVIKKEYEDSQKETANG